MFLLLIFMIQIEKSANNNKHNILVTHQNYEEKSNRCITLSVQSPEHDKRPSVKETWNGDKLSLCENKQTSLEYLPIGSVEVLNRYMYHQTLSSRHLGPQKTPSCT